MPYGVENLLACPKWKAKGRRRQCEQVWDLACTTGTVAMKRHGWTDCKSSPTAHHWYHSVSETLRNTVQKKGFPALKPIKTDLLHYSCVLIVQHLTLARKDCFITNTGEKSSDVFVTTVNRTVFVSQKNANYKAFLFPVIKLYSCINVRSNNLREQKSLCLK